jgi:hypothetical protein
MNLGKEVPEVDPTIAELGGLLKSAINCAKVCLAKSEEEYKGDYNISLHFMTSYLSNISTFSL